MSYTLDLSGRVALITGANTGAQILSDAQAAGFPLADLVAARAQAVSSEAVGPEVAVAEGSHWVLLERGDAEGAAVPASALAASLPDTSSVASRSWRAV